MKKPEFQIIHTEDGSDSVLIKNTAISFHSTHGAIQESNHIFIDAGLRYFAGLHSTHTVRMFEMGFGTGLNALLTAMAAPGLKKNIIYHTIDLFPLPVEIYSKLNFPALLHETELYNRIMLSGWNQQLYMSPFFKLNKIKADITFWDLQETYDIIYFDAFAPEEQPELWTDIIFKKIRNHLSVGGVLTTYCSKSTVRKALTDAGFAVEKLNGPRGKREIVRATAA